MATVRMADYLRRDIVRKFEQLYDKSNPQIEHSTHVGDKMYDIFLGGKVLQFKEQISNIFGDIIDPDSMFIKSSTLPVSINMMVYDDIREYNDLEDKYITQVKEQFEDGHQMFHRHFLFHSQFSYHIYQCSLHLVKRHKLHKL